MFKKSIVGGYIIGKKVYVTPERVTIEEINFAKDIKKLTKRKEKT
jgi:hypothetical protein